MSKLPELKEYRKFTAPAELHKAINTLKGIIAGITTDKEVSEDEINELSFWCTSHADLSHCHPFNELIPLIASVYEDGLVTQSEAEDILWLCNNFSEESSYYDSTTSSLQFLNGMLHGIMADGVLSNEEIISLKEWIRDNDFLTGCYPFDEIESLLLSILDDGIITEDERNTLKAFLSNFIDTQVSYNLTENSMEDLRKQYSVSGICSICQEINFEGSVFCFTGQSTCAKRSEIAKVIESLGGIFQNNINSKTKYLIVGNNGNPCWAFSCYGRKIEDAETRRKNG